MLSHRRRAGERRNLIGLAFEPAPARTLPDVDGVLWLDGQTLELRLVEFRHTGLPRLQYADRLGGEVHFARLPNGAWIVRRWFLRMPQFAVVWRPIDQYRRDRSDRAPPGEMYRIVEVGGTVAAEAVQVFEPTATVRGTARDSVGRALSRAEVRLSGTGHAATVKADGSFELAGVPPGVYELVAEHPGYAFFGLTAATQEIAVEPGARVRVALHAFGTDSLLRAICSGEPMPRGLATLFVRLLDSAAVEPTPLANAALRVYWVVRDTVGLMEYSWEHERRTRTAADGSAAFCSLPAHHNLELEYTAPQRRRIERFRLQENETRASAIRSTPPHP